MTETEKQIAHDQHSGQIPSSLAATIYVFLRVLQPILEYSFLAYGLGVSVFLRYFGGNQILDNDVDMSPVLLGLDPLRLALFTLSVLSSVKEIFDLVFTAESKAMTVRTAVLSGSFKQISTLITSLLFCWARYSANWMYILKDLNGQGMSDKPMLPPLLSICWAVVATCVISTAYLGAQRKWLGNRNTDLGRNGQPFAVTLYRSTGQVVYGGFTLWKALGLEAIGLWGVFITLVWVFGGFKAYGYDAPSLSFDVREMRMWSPIFHFSQLG